MLSDTYFANKNNIQRTSLKLKQERNYTLTSNNESNNNMFDFDPFRAVDLSEPIAFTMNIPTQVEVPPLKDDPSPTATNFL